ncbi:MAG: VOC family protein [Deltaproteobacteria bacterium]|jgi:catechol 2,3-dioxygenase-like lactoylglutathione lyase family enzyme|nr:VOC family protein [Deltaproteobacteria bacterium]
MNLKHVALVSSSEERADTFYAVLLGLTKSEPKTLPRELSKAIFNVDQKLVMINYRDDRVHFEIFIAPSDGENSTKIEHTCLEVDDLDVFLEKCHRLNIDVRRIPKGDKTLTFIRDFDGNLFEIKAG